MAALGNAYEVVAHMLNNMETLTFRDVDQEFLPRSVFDEVTTKEVIQRLVSQDDQLGGNDVDFIERIHKEGQKLFATCVFTKHPLSYLKTFFAAGLTDAKFPFTVKDCPAVKDKQGFVTSFFQNQKRFNTAYFALGSFQNLDKNTMKPIEYDPEDESSRLGRGSYGGVFSVKIHSDHRGFKLVSRKDEFAMKVTSREGRDQKFNQAMATLPHPHLLQCLASFTFSTEYFMIYEKADGDLENFMQRNANSGSLSGLTDTDFAKQLGGLASALSVIHYQRNDSNTLTVPEAGLTSYNHDIKPGNILMFIYNRHGKKTYWLRMADHSLAKINEYNGKNRDSHITRDKVGTLTYQAPESVICRGISRPYDIWSLGCVYLELLVWYQEGFDKLNDFRDARMSETGSTVYEDDGFYRLITPKEAELRPCVVEKVEKLRATCEGPLKEIADIIPTMLEIDFKKRPNAQRLVALLGHLDSGDDAPPEVVATGDYPHVSIAGSPQISMFESDSEIEDMFKVTITKPT